MPITKHFLPFSIILLAVISCQKTPENLAATKAQLGEKLFFDPILSRDSTISCASCHRPEHAFADITPTSKGVFNRMGGRNTPSCMNMTNRNFYFWDGRAETLEEQALGPIENPVEMDLPLSVAVKRLRANPYYYNSFINVFGAKPDKDLLANAIAEFERTLETSKSPFDKFMREDDSTAISASAKRGLDVFNGKGNCFDCHFGIDFTGNDQFRNIGLYNGKDLNDKGRFDVTGKESDLGRFKVPGLRNIAMTAPYMHNGMHKTLMEVIEYYNEPDKFVKNSINRDSLLNKPLGLTQEEKKDLENFLLTLTDERFKK
ncbi:MAG: cytochrome-c peroxidase [Bacteroidia bacterium]|nr:cytochrome-c peroxidase [Sphingobacteriaceae bacterium]MBP9068483.1 cytochrome-c peroxidase [Bacteroidia bacterium]